MSFDDSSLVCVVAVNEKARVVYIPGTDVSEKSETLFILQQQLENGLLTQIKEFERLSGMRVHSVKLFPGPEAKDGRRKTAALEVSAQLR